MTLNNWELLLITFAWNGLSAVLSSLGVPAIVIQAIAAVLTQFGLLQGSVPCSKEELVAKAEKVKAHCATLDCPPPCPPC